MFVFILLIVLFIQIIQMSCSNTNCGLFKQVFIMVLFMLSLSFSLSLFFFCDAFCLIFIGVQLIYSVVLVSSISQSELAVQIHISPLFKIFFSQNRLLQNAEQNFLCYIVYPCQLSVFCIVECICQSQSPNLSLPSLPLVNNKFIFYICDSISVL